MSASLRGEFLVREVRLAKGSADFGLGGRALRLRKFQEDILLAIKERKPLIVSAWAPPVSGKTLAALLPLQLGYRGAVAVYPSGSDADAHFGSVNAYLEELGAVDATEELLPEVVEDVACLDPHKLGFWGDLGERVQDMLSNAFRSDQRADLVRSLAAAVKFWKAPSGRVVGVVRLTPSGLDTVAEALGLRSSGAARRVTAFTAVQLLLAWPASSAYWVTVTIPAYPYIALGVAWSVNEHVGLFTKQHVVPLLDSLLSAIVGGDTGLWVDAIRRVETSLRGLGRVEKWLGVVSRIPSTLFSDRVLVFDDVHLYRGPSIPSLLSLLAMYFLGTRGSWTHFRHQKAVLLSGVPDPPLFPVVMALAKALGAGVVEVEPGLGREGDVVRAATLVRVYGAPTYYADPVPALYELQRKVSSMDSAAEELVSLKGGGKAIAFFDKLLCVDRFAERLKSVNPAIYTSLRELEELPDWAFTGSPEEADVIVGDAAVSFGVTVPSIEAGLVTGVDWATVLSRVARVGIRRSPEPPCTVLLFLPDHLLRRDEGYAVLEGAVDWTKFAEWLRSTLPDPQTPSTVMGAGFVRFLLALLLFGVATWRTELVTREFPETVERILEALTERRPDAVARELLRLVRGADLTSGALFRLLSFWGGIRCPMYSSRVPRPFMRDLLAVGRNYLLSFRKRGKSGRLYYNREERRDAILAIELHVSDLPEEVKGLAKRLVTLGTFVRTLKESGVPAWLTQYYRSRGEAVKKTVAKLADVVEALRLEDAPIAFLPTGRGIPEWFVSAVSEAGPGLRVLKYDARGRIPYRELRVNTVGVLIFV